MLGEMLDTPPEARRIYYERLAQLTPAERLAMMRRSSRMIRNLAESSIRREHPDASPDELRIRLAVRLYGRDVVEGLLGPAPVDAR
ncbi:MAG: hypothetical protein WA208_11885 [Thermoanaerobaculia bacterium]